MTSSGQPFGDNSGGFNLSDTGQDAAAVERLASDALGKAIYDVLHDAWASPRDIPLDAIARFIVAVVESSPLVAAIRAEANKEYEWADMLVEQTCPAGQHNSWFVDDEWFYACPWCEIERLRTAASPS
jgi:hypothetical protein